MRVTSEVNQLYESQPAVVVWQKHFDVLPNLEHSGVLTLPLGFGSFSFVCGLLLILGISKLRLSLFLAAVLRVKDCLEDGSIIDAVVFVGVSQ